METLFEPGQANFRDLRIRKGVDYLLELKSKGYFDKEQLSYDYFAEFRESFSRGKGGLFIGQLSDLANWKEFSDAFGAKNCGYFPNWIVPESVVKDAQVVDLGDVGYSIMNWSWYPDLAAGYLKMWAVGEGAENLLMAGAFPPSAKLHIDAVGSSYPAVVDVIKAVSDGPVVLPFSHFMPDNAVIHKGVNRHIELLITAGEIGVDEFIDGIQSKLEEYFLAVTNGSCLRSTCGIRIYGISAGRQL